MSKYVLAILHRELRVENNSVISMACKIAHTTGTKVLVCFKFDERQINPEKNKYFGANSFMFMLESLREIAADVHMFNSVELSRIAQKSHCIVCAADYTPFAATRLLEYKKFAVPIVQVTEHIITHPDLIRAKNGNVFTMNYALFANAAEKKSKNANDERVLTMESGARADKKLLIRPNKRKNLQVIDHLAEMLRLMKYDVTSDVRGGRSHALKRVREVAGWRSGYYKSIRDVLAENTSRLSAYMKFGCVGLHELWKMMSEKNLRRQFLWRSYYYYLSYHFPEEVWVQREFPGALKQPWGRKEGLRELMDGKTGVELVDAGISQLRKTGFVHNRVRMITADYCKRMKIDWTAMERLYARFLTDYDPAVNLLNWMYMNGAWHYQFKTRYFNPETQAKKFDQKKVYVRKFLHH